MAKRRSDSYNDRMTTPERAGLRRPANRVVVCEGCGTRFLRPNRPGATLLVPDHDCAALARNNGYKRKDS